MSTPQHPKPISFDDQTEATPIIPAPLNTIKLIRHISRTPDWTRLEKLRVDVRDVESGLRVMGAMLRYQQERGVGRAERVMGEVVN